MSEIDHAADLKRRFPKMKPTTGAPTLFTLNGCGLGMYGRRDFDDETGTYLKTRCLCLIFVPLIALDTYRVADAEGGGWYFLGKERASKFARVWRVLLVGGVVSMIAGSAWDAHLESPGYRMGIAREEASELVAKGDAMGAVKVYDELLEEGLGNASEWREKMSELLLSEIDSGDSARALEAVSFAGKRRSSGLAGGPLVPGLADHALNAARLAGAEKGSEILAAFTPDPGDLARVNEMKREFLEELYESNPDDHEVAVQLALVREAAGEADGALELLEPASASLGDGEGARLYGMLLMGGGRYAEALPHLESYVTPRSKEWKQAERKFEQEYEAGQQRVIDALNRGEMPPGFAERYDAANETEQQQMVDEHIANKLMNDKRFLRARDTYEESTAVVPAIMDLGIAKLRVAQADSDPERRKELLGDAEKTFLSLQGVAGETDDYRIFLGQVYYWSGRGDEGQKLFDALLDDSGRKYENLYGVGEMLRDLGENEQARKLLEEAYEKATDPAQKSTVVVMRSLLAKDLDDKIAWLEKGDSSVAQVEIGLAEAHGQRAEEKGDIEAAVKAYRRALTGYEKQTRNSAQLNNSSLIYRALYRLEGDAEHFDKAARMLSEAVALEPNDSILSANAADSHLMAAVLRIVGDKIDPKIIQNYLSLDLLRFLYRNEEEKEQVIAKLVADPNYRKSLKYFQDALVLAPKNPGSYAGLAQIFQYVNDEAGMADVVERAKAVSFDFTEANESREQFLNGEMDEKLRDAIKVAVIQDAKLIASVESEEAKCMARGLEANSRLSGFAFDADLNFPEWMPALAAARATVPCSSLDATVGRACESQAIENLTKADPEVLELVESARRHLGASSILRLLVRAKGELGERVRKDESVIRARELAREIEAEFQSHISGEDWAIIEGMDGVDSVALANRLKGNTMGRLSVEFRGLVGPADHPSVVIEELWLCLAEGDGAGVAERVGKLEALGIKMPAL